MLGLGLGRPEVIGASRAYLDIGHHGIQHIHLYTLFRIPALGPVHDFCLLRRTEAPVPLLEKVRGLVDDHPAFGFEPKPGLLMKVPIDLKRPLTFEL